MPEAPAVYLDYNATTPIAPEARAAMAPFLAADFGNASSRHSLGRRARAAVDAAREQVAAAVNARPEEVVFTSSGTESNNTIIKGVATLSTRKHVATSAVEHPCVLCAARALARISFDYAPIAVEKSGLIDFSDFESVVNSECALASLMLANNETGALQDVARAAAVARRQKAVMHTDAAQALGKIAVDFRALGVDSMTLSSHKAYGPKGAAALIVRGEVAWAPLLDGGGHENGRRSGTENVAAIVGFGRACEIAAARYAKDAARLSKLRDAMEDELRAVGAVVFGDGARRLPNTSYFGFPQIDGETFVVMADQSGFALAAGAACASMKEEPSHVLLAMEVDPDLARTAVRASLGRETGEDDIARFVAAAAQIAKRLRALSAVVG